MSSLRETYTYIADILSFKVSAEDLKPILIDPNFNWDEIVVEASKHLVLPAIYCRLKSKALLDYLPKDLVLYLSEITYQNRQRNIAILKQVSQLDQLFKKHQINYVFLKGAALLAMNAYEDIAERMVGDIDILVDIKQLEEAFELLQLQGYMAMKQTLGHTFFEHKHLPRLKPNQEIAAVELHKKLFVSYDDSILSSDNILNHKRHVSGINVPSLQHLMRHNILNYQINDYGIHYNSLNLRSAYDTIILLQHFNFDDSNKKHHLSSYINISGLFFKDILLLQPRKTLSTKLYLFKLEHIKFYRFWNSLIRIKLLINAIGSRVPVFLTNNAYRTAIWKDKKRILTELKTALSP